MVQDQICRLADTGALNIQSSRQAYLIHEMFSMLNDEGFGRNPGRHPCRMRGRRPGDPPPNQQYMKLWLFKNSISTPIGEGLIEGCSKSRELCPTLACGVLSHMMPSSQANVDPKREDILIVGAGIFGLTTALELRERGYEKITVLDRYARPVPDGSSVDISRVIRFDYGDPVYAKMALEAMKGWETPKLQHRNHVPK